MGFRLYPVPVKDLGMVVDKAFLELLRDRVSIVDLVSKYISLVKKGSNSWGCCPFHNEKTASFSVVEDKNFYHCFGCGAHGDIVSFVMQFLHLSFIEAVEKICQDFGIEIPVVTEEQKKKDKESHDLYEVFRLALEFYEKQLHSDEGIDGINYFKSRQLSDEIISNFHLCYAPKGIDKLYQYLKDKEIPVDLMLKAGLCRISNRTGKPYDYFRDRVLFPITDSRGRVIAFGGRIIVKDDNLPKYLNSPESVIFSKGRNLYGLAQARISAIENKMVIATEGYMDCISLHKFGFNMAVAPLGTALTEMQIELMWKLAVEPILCFDSDNAGRMASIRAALRVLPILKPGYSVKFCLLEGAKDPDEFLNKFGSEKFKDVLDKKCISLVDILWMYFTSDKNITTPEQKAGLEQLILNEMNKVKSESIKKFYLEEFKKRMNKQYSNLSGEKKVILPKVDPDNLNEKMILAFSVAYPSLFAKFLETGKKITLLNKRYKNVFDIVVGEISVNPHTRDSIIQYLNDKGFKVDVMLKFEIESLLKNPLQAEKLLKERVLNFDLERLNLELSDLNRKVLILKNEDEISFVKNKIDAIKEEINDIHMKLSEDFD